MGSLLSKQVSAIFAYAMPWNLEAFFRFRRQAPG
jgi:hypothetical protein